MGLVVYNFTRDPGATPLQIKLDLDESRGNEKAILNYLRSGSLFEPDVGNLLVKVLEEGDVAVDVGANVGFFTVLASILVGPTGRVAAFEPSGENLKRLRANLAHNDCSNVTVIEKAVTNQVGEVEFFLNSGDSGGNALWDIAQWPGYLEQNGAPLRVAVPATTLDFEWERLRCLVPGFDGAFLLHDSKDALWDKFYTAAPPRRRLSVEQYKIVKRA